MKRACPWPVPAQLFGRASLQPFNSVKFCHGKSLFMLLRTNQLMIALHNVKVSQVGNVKVVQAHVETVVAGMKKVHVQREISRVSHVESPAILLGGVPSPGLSSHNIVLTTLVRWRQVLHRLRRIQDKGRHRKVHAMELEGGDMQCTALRSFSPHSNVS